MIQLIAEVDGAAFAAISVYAPQCSLNENVKDEFYDMLIAAASKVGEKEVLAVVGDLNCHIENISGGFDGGNCGNGMVIEIRKEKES